MKQNETQNQRPNEIRTGTVRCVTRKIIAVAILLCTIGLVGFTVYSYLTAKSNHPTLTPQQLSQFKSIQSKLLFTKRANALERHFIERANALRLKKDYTRAALCWVAVSELQQAYRGERSESASEDPSISEQMAGIYFSQSGKEVGLAYKVILKDRYPNWNPTQPKTKEKE
jgi:hypothetical protein